MENQPETKVTLIYWPEKRELMLFKRCIWVTMGKTEMPVSAPSSKLLRDVLNARHVHAVPFVSSLRNDRQDRTNGDEAPRNTPVDMIFFCNAEELMTVANKRLCGKASAKTREVAGMMCDEAAKVMPEIAEFLVPNCLWHGGVCHELESCGRCIRG